MSRARAPGRCLTLRCGRACAGALSCRPIDVLDHAIVARPTTARERVHRLCAIVEEEEGSTPPCSAHPNQPTLDHSVLDQFPRLSIACQEQVPSKDLAPREVHGEAARVAVVGSKGILPSLHTLPQEIPALLASNRMACGGRRSGGALINNGPLSQVAFDRPCLRLAIPAWVEQAMLAVIEVSYEVDAPLPGAFRSEVDVFIAIPPRACRSSWPSSVSPVMMTPAKRQGGRQR